MRDTLILLAVLGGLWAPALVALVWLRSVAKVGAQQITAHDLAARVLQEHAQALEQHAAHIREHCQNDAQHREVLGKVLEELKLQDRQIQAQEEQIQALHREAAARG